jgi:hypothetical protein
MKNKPGHGSKTEFDWEKEIRRDEMRINAYMRELRNFIDLPGEEEMILEKIQKRPELVPHNVKMSNLSFSDIFDDMDDDFLFGSEWQKKDGADIYMLLEKLACHWCRVFSTELPPPLMENGLKIICLLGKLMARTADIIEMEDREMPALKLALCKRTAADINLLTGELKKISDDEKKLEPLTGNHISNLHNVREKLIDLMAEMRKIIAEKGGNPPGHGP